MYCIHTAEDVVKLCSPSGSPIILVFNSYTTKYMGGKNLRLLTETAVYLGNGIRDMRMELQRNVNRKSVVGGGSIRVGYDDLE